MTLSHNEARDALAAMRDARMRANDMRRLPFAYHLAVGVLLAGWVYVQNLSHRELQLGILALVGLSVAMYKWQRRATGRFVNGFRMGRTLVVAIVLLLVMVALLFISSPLHFPDRQLLAPWQAALLAFVIGAFLDWLWVKAYDADIKAGR